MQSKSAPSQPRSWFNQDEHPAFVFGQYGIPAFVLPFLTSMIWFFSRRALRAQLAANVRALPRRLAEAPRQDGQLQGLDRTMKRVHLHILTVVFLSRDKLHMHLYSPLCCFEAGSMLYTATITPESETRIPCLMAALGWLISLGFDHLPALATVSLLLSVPCALMPLNPRQAHVWPSGSFLLINALDNHPIFADVTAWLDEYPYWRSIAVIFLVVLSQAIKRIYSGESIIQQEELRKFLPMVLHISTLLIPFMLSSVATAFCLSCLGWRYLIFSAPSEGPTLNVLSLTFGFILCMPIWAILRSFVHYRRPDPSSWADLQPALHYESLLNFDVVGIACTIQTGMWMLLSSRILGLS